MEFYFNIEDKIFTVELDNTKIEYFCGIIQHPYLFALLKSIEDLTNNSFIDLYEHDNIIYNVGTCIPINENIQLYRTREEAYYLYIDKNKFGPDYTGIIKHYDLYGKCILEYQYKNGKKNGISKEYSVDGYLTYEMEYIDGKLLDTIKKFDENGKIISDFYIHPITEYICQTLYPYFEIPCKDHYFTDDEINEWWNSTKDLRFQINNRLDELYTSGNEDCFLVESSSTDNKKSYRFQNGYGKIYEIVCIGNFKEILTVTNLQ